MESCQEEGVSTDFQVDYVDNVPCIDFISSLVRKLIGAIGITIGFIITVTFPNELSMSSLLTFSWNNSDN